MRKEGLVYRDSRGRLDKGLDEYFVAQSGRPTLGHVFQG